MKCIRCDMEISPNEKILVNDECEFAHDDCIGIDDLDENWVEYNNKEKEELEDVIYALQETLRQEQMMSGKYEKALKQIAQYNGNSYLSIETLKTIANKALNN